MKRRICMLALLPLVLLALGWKENFSELKTSNKSEEGKWYLHQDAAMTASNGSFEAVATKNQPRISRRLPRDARGKYLQMRIDDGTRRVLFDMNNSFFTDWFSPRPGLFTIPIKESARPDGKKPTSFGIRMNGKLKFSELALVDENAVDGVFITILDGEGKVKDANTAGVAGDTVCIEMQVKDKPDNLALYLYQINGTTNWAYRGRFEALTLPGVPIELKECEIPGRYRATFKLQKLQAPLKIDGNKLVAAINFFGGDLNNRGFYYGFCANPIDIEAGVAETQETDLLVYDFGPPTGEIAPDAIAINNNSKHPSFRWTKRPYSYMVGGRKELDPLLIDWAEIKANSYAEMEIKVKPGKYKVVVGLGGAIASCWLHHVRRPLRATIFINGKQEWEYNAPESERFTLMDVEAKVTDKLFDKYIAPHLKDPAFDVDCANGAIKIKVAASQKTATPLNYVAVFPAEDSNSAARLARMQAARKQVFNEFWQIITPSEKTLLTPLSIKEYDAQGKDFAIYARENPYEYIFLKTRPLLSEVGAPLRILAAQGQYGVGTILLHTFVPVENAQVKLELPDFPGATVSFIMPFHFVSHQTRRCYIAPNHYMPFGVRSLIKDQSYGARLCFKVPEAMKQGTYKGEVTFSGNKQVAKLPIEVRVIGEKLPELSDHLIAMVGNAEDVAKGYRFEREALGCTTALVEYGRTRDAKFKTDENGMPIDVDRNKEHVKRSFERYKEAGFPCKTPFIHLGAAANRLDYYRQGPYKIYTKEYEIAYKLQLELIVEMATKYGGCTSVIADLGGEMGYGLNFPKQEVMDAAKEVFKQTVRVPGMLASYRCNGSETTKQFYPYLQVQGVRDPGSWPVSDEQSNFGKNKHLYTYSIEGRFQNGLHSWAHGARGNLREFLLFRHQIEYNSFLTCTGLCGNFPHLEAMPGPDGDVVPTVRSDAFRASVIDRQYIRLLENEIKASKYAEAKAEAEAFLSMLRYIAYTWKTDQGTSWMYTNNPWPGLRLDMMREIIITLCEELRTGKKTLPRFSAMPKVLADPIPEQPKTEDVLKEPESAKDLPYKHWRDIHTGDSWEKQGLPYDGCAWYRKAIKIPKDFQTPVLRIGSADEEAWLFCNGKYIGYHNGWNSAFQFPLDNVKGGDTAEIAIFIYDSMAMGGIWRSVTLHKNEEDAKANRAGINQDPGWKIALSPKGRKLDKFEFASGPIVPTNVNDCELQVMLVPENNEQLLDLAKTDVQFEIHDTKGKLLRKENLGKIVPYNTKRMHVSLQGIQEDVCDAVLVTGSKEYARFRFYRIPLWKP